MPVRISYEFPDEFAQRIVQAFCVRHGYQPQLRNPDNPVELLPNPETPAEFARRKVAEYVKGEVIAFESEYRIEQAKQQVVSDLRTEVDAAQINIIAEIVGDQVTAEGKVGFNVPPMEKVNVSNPTEDTGDE